MSKENRNPRIRGNGNRSGLAVSDFEIRAFFVIGHSSFVIQSAPPPIANRRQGRLPFGATSHSLSCCSWFATAALIYHRNPQLAPSNRSGPCSTRRSTPGTPATLAGSWKVTRGPTGRGCDVSLGWQTVFDRYQKRYGDRASMGVLKFSEVEVTVLAPDAAFAVGRWRLERAQDAPSGLFTLLFPRESAGWRIVQDHTSAAESPTISRELGGTK